MCRTKEEAKTAHDTLSELLVPAGMPLKLGYENAVHRLTPADPADWLGFQLTRQKKELVVAIADRSWERLCEKLSRARMELNYLNSASAVLRGWLSQSGPCYPHLNHKKAYSRIKSMSREAGFTEKPSKKQIRDVWQRAFARWGRLRTRVLSDLL